MIVLFMDVSIFYYWMFFEDASFFFCFNHSFWPCCSEFFTSPYLWEISFSSHMIVKLSVGYWA